MSFHVHVDSVDWRTLGRIWYGLLLSLLFGVNSVVYLFCCHEIPSNWYFHNILSCQVISPHILIWYEFTCDISRCITCLDSYCLSASALARARSRSPPTPSGRPNKVADGAVSFGAVTRFPDVSWCFLFAVSPSMSCPCASFTHETQEKSEKKSTISDFQAFAYAISRMTPRMTNSCAQTFFFFLAAQASAPLTKSSLSSSTCRFKIRMSFRSQTNPNKSKGRNSQSTKNIFYQYLYYIYIYSNYIHIYIYYIIIIYTYICLIDILYSRIVTIS